jgi:hypothetical protein
MKMPPPVLMRVPVWCRQMCALAVLSLLAGCANADFGEVNSTLVTDDIHKWIGPYAIGGKQKSLPSFGLTYDERELRDLAYPLIEPPFDRQQWYSVAGEYGLYKPDRRAPYDHTAYASRLYQTWARSPLARYSHLIDDIRNDTTRLPAFFETAARVLDTDAKRRKSMAYIRELSPLERKSAHRRMQENSHIVSLVRESLENRTSSYRFALERLVVMSPSRDAVEAEQELNRLRTEIARYRTPYTPTWVREPSLAAAR